MRCKGHFSFYCDFKSKQQLFALCVRPLNGAHTKEDNMCAVNLCQAQFKCLVILVNIGCLEQLKLLDSVKGSVWPSGAEHDLQCPLKSLLASVIKYRILNEMFWNLVYELVLVGSLDKQSRREMRL